MARRVFFSFHYERDVWRASVVRKSWVTKRDREAAGFWDAAEWEKVKKTGDNAVRRWIDRNLLGTSVTVVLIGKETVGKETANRKWVKYEIIKSFEKGNGLLGVYIHNLRDRDGRTDSKGRNPFDVLCVMREDKKIPLSKIYKTYDWVYDDGYDNIGKWIEGAAEWAYKDRWLRMFLRNKNRLKVGECDD